MRPPCGFEGPRGGGCRRARVWVVEAGDRETGPHALGGACDAHLKDMRAWAFSITNLIPRVVTSEEYIQQHAAKKS